MKTYHIHIDLITDIDANSEEEAREMIQERANPSQWHVEEDMSHIHFFEVAP